MKITKREFEEIVAAKIEMLPDVIKQRLENIEFFVEESSSPDLLGLYHGIPFPNRKSPSYSLVMPDKIILFKESIEKRCRTMQELEKKIARVLFHEIGHYMGLDEEDLKKLNL